VASRLNRDALRVLANNLIETGKYRLLDIVMREFDERAARVKTPVPNRLLFRRYIHRCTAASLI
jgi:hypothetical protein